jgi:hypothetical protein
MTRIIRDTREIRGKTLPKSVPRAGAGSAEQKKPEKETAEILPRSTSMFSAWSAVHSEKLFVAFPQKRGIMECVRRPRACSLTFCRGKAAGKGTGKKEEGRRKKEEG